MLFRSFLIFTTCFLFYITFSNLLNAETVEGQKNCQITPENTGGVYKFKKIVVLITYSDKFSEAKHTFPSALKRENFSRLVQKEIAINFSEQRKNSTSEIKPIVFLKSAKRGEGREEIRDVDNLAILINVYYTPGAVTTPSGDDYGHISFYIFRKDWDDASAIIPNPNNSGFISIFPKQQDLETVIERFVKNIRPIPIGILNRCQISR